MSVFDPRMERITTAMRRDGLDVLIATTVENVYYVTGYHGLGEWSTYTRGIWVAITAEGSRYLLVPVGELDYAAMLEGWEAQEVIPYGSFYWHNAGRPSPDASQPDDGAAPWDGDSLKLAQVLDQYQDGLQASQEAALRAALDRIGLRAPVIGFDEEGVSLGQLDVITAVCGTGARRAGHILRGARRRKFPEEITVLREAVSITETAFTEAVRSLHRGQTEVEVARVFERTLAEHSMWPETTVIASGQRSMFPNAEAAGKEVLPGTILRFDIGGLYRQYHSDISRTVLIERGHPDPRTSRYAAALLAGHEAALGTIRPGVRAREVFEAAIAATRDSGIPHYQRHHVGHGIGLQTYETLLVAPQDDTVLETGMVLCIELPYYELGLGGLQIEDTIVVRADGFEPLTTLPREFPTAILADQV